MNITVRAGVGYSSSKGDNVVNVGTFIYPKDNDPYNISLDALLIKGASEGKEADQKVELLTLHEKKLIQQFYESFKKDQGLWKKVYKKELYFKSKFTIYRSEFREIEVVDLDKLLQRMFDETFVDILEEAKQVTI